MWKGNAPDGFTAGSSGCHCQWNTHWSRATSNRPSTQRYQPETHCKIFEILPEILPVQTPRGCSENPPKFSMATSVLGDIYGLKSIANCLRGPDSKTFFKTLENGTGPCCTTAILSVFPPRCEGIETWEGRKDQDLLINP